MAQLMLHSRPMLFLIAAISCAPIFGGACVVPLDFELSSFDAGVSSPPVIVSAGPAPDFSFPGPMILDRQDDRTLSLTVRDNDFDDVIHVRLYIDYGRPNPAPAYGECRAASTGESTRVVACPLNTICNSIEDTDQGEHVLEAMVADREFLPDSDPAAEGQDLFRALRDNTRAGVSFGSWIMRCNAPVEI